MTIVHQPLVAIPAPTVGRGREVRHLHLVPSTPVFVQGALELSYSMPSGVDAVPAAAAADQREAEDVGPIPSPQAWAGRYVQAVVEVLAQQRPVSQLARWTAANVYSELARVHRAASRQPRDGEGPRPLRQTVVSVRVMRVGADAAEVAARVVEGQRSRAVAARLDFRRGRWTCTALAVG